MPECGYYKLHLTHASLGWFGKKKPDDFHNLSSKSENSDFPFTLYVLARHYTTGGTRPPFSPQVNTTTTTEDVVRSTISKAKTNLRKVVDIKRLAPKYLDHAHTFNACAWSKYCRASRLL